MLNLRFQTRWHPIMAPETVASEAKVAKTITRRTIRIKIRAVKIKVI